MFAFKEEDLCFCSLKEINYESLNNFRTLKFVQIAQKIDVLGVIDCYFKIFYYRLYNVYSELFEFSISLFIRNNVEAILHPLQVSE